MEPRQPEYIDGQRVVVGRLGTAIILAVLVAVACGPVSFGAWSMFTQVSRSPLVADAISRAEAHPTVRQVLGEPLSVSTIVTRDSDLSYSAGGTSLSTPFWRPGAIRKRISLLTTIAGPKGNAYFSVSGTEDLRTGEWRDVRMEVSGSDLDDIRSFSVDLTKPDEPGSVVRSSE